MGHVAEHPARKLEVLQACGYFDSIEKVVLQDIARGMRLRSYRKGEVMIWEGEPCSGLFILERGSVKLFKLSPQGRELIIRVFEEGATFNEVPVFDRGTNPVNVAALEASDCWVVDPDVIRRAMRAHPSMADAVIGKLGENLRNLVNKVEMLCFCQVTNRLARLIQETPQEQLSRGGERRITQDEMAARLGTVREVIARSMRELERSGAIKVRQRSIEIADPQVLEQWSGVDDD